jgi:hypothetical protein
VDAENGEPLASAVTASGDEKPGRMSTDLFRPREGRDLVWHNMTVSFSVKAKQGGGSRKIVDGVWGRVPAKQVTAIMGPSGRNVLKLIFDQCMYLILVVSVVAPVERLRF